MADKAINDLTQALQITNEDLFVLEQSGTAKKLKGATLLDYVTLSVVSVTVTTLPAGSSATATYNKSTGTLALGIPTGPQGPQGIQGTKGDPGADAPTITNITIRQSDYHLIVTLSDGTSYDAGYCRGASGAGTGDMLASVYDPNNKHQDIFAYVDNAIKDVKVTTDATPTQGSTNPVQSGGVYLALANKLDKTGDGSNVTAAFTAATTRANIATGEKLSVLFGKIAKWFADLGSLAFKSTVAKSDLAGDVQTSLGKADSAFADKVSKSGDTMTGKLTVPQVETGDGNSNFFQCRKFRGEGDANAYYHAIDFGYRNHDQVDFHEYGGIWNFFKNISGKANEGSLCGKITTNGWEGGAKLTGSPTAPTPGTSDNSTRIATTAFVNSFNSTKLESNGDGSNVTAAFTAASTRANIATGEKLSVLFGKIAKWFADLGSLAFKSTVSKSDLASDVQTSLGKADSALQSYTETDPTVPAWAKAKTKPSYSKSEVGLGNVDNVKQYSADNPPPYPVTSVNGKTGAVTIPSVNVPSTTSLLKGNGSGGLVAATRGSDYIASGNIVKQTLVATETTPTENYAINWVYG